jgi:hypothetical protein
MDFHILGFGNWNALGPNSLGHLLVVGSKRNTDISVILGRNRYRSSILREKTATHKMASPKFMRYHNIDGSNFIYSCRSTFLRIARKRIRNTLTAVAHFQSWTRFFDRLKRRLDFALASFFNLTVKRKLVRAKDVSSVLLKRMLKAYKIKTFNSGAFFV